MKAALVIKPPSSFDLVSWALIIEALTFLGTEKDIKEASELAITLYHEGRVTPANMGTGLDDYIKRNKHVSINKSLCTMCKLSASNEGDCISCYNGANAITCKSFEPLDHVEVM